VIGYLPLTTAVVYPGALAQTLSTSDPLFWVAVAVLLALFLSERLFRRRQRDKEIRSGAGYAPSGHQAGDGARADRPA
jgi:hypothetical protein